MRIESTGLAEELEAAGIPMHGCCLAESRVDFMDEATSEQRALAAQIVAAHDPTAALAKRAATVRLEAAIAAKQRQMALARLAIEDEYPGAAEAQTKLDAEIKALAVVADAAGDMPVSEAVKG